MWCIKCGTKLPDEAKFCCNCGEQVYQSESQSNQSTMAENAQEVREQQVTEQQSQNSSNLGKRLELLEEGIQYNKFQQKYQLVIHENMIAELAQIFQKQSFERAYYLPTAQNDPVIHTKLETALSTYANLEQETALFLYDDSSLDNGKTGFIITNKNIYYSNVENQAGKIGIMDCYRIEKNAYSKNISINQNSISVGLMNEYKRELFKEFIEFAVLVLRCNELKDTNFYQKTAIPNQNSLPVNVQVNPNQMNQNHRNEVGRERKNGWSIGEVIGTGILGLFAGFFYYYCRIEWLENNATPSEGLEFLAKLGDRYGYEYLYSYNDEIFERYMTSCMIYGVIGSLIIYAIITYLRKQKA